MTSNVSERKKLIPLGLLLFFALIVFGCQGAVSVSQEEKDGASLLENDSFNDDGEMAADRAPQSDNEQIGWDDGGLPIDRDPCEGVNCSGHGQCINSEGKASCQCEKDYHPAGLGCIKDCVGNECFEWPMLAANPQRTSWVQEEVRGDLSVEWYHPLEPYIPYKIQPIAANGIIYVSTARGLYAFGAANGDLLWVYSTELPLGHSPTIAKVNDQSIAFVGGYDHKIHAMDAITGQSIPGYIPYEADAGFETNPLVVNNVIYAGNRDSNFYALDAITGSLRWKYKTGGPILTSAAYQNDVLYFASNDMFAYALNATDGSLIWKSGKFPGQGFFSFWPVIYTHLATGKDYVIFNGGQNYRNSEFWVATSENDVGETSIFNSYDLPNGRLPQTGSSISGDWAAGTVTLDASVILDYFSKYPNRRSGYIVEAQNGQEHSFTYNGKKTYAPFDYSGVTRGGSKYPPLVNGLDGVFYQQTAYAGYDGWIDLGAPVGWKFETPYLSEVSEQAQASDEPVAFSSGGKIIYWTLCCDRFAKAFDVTIPLGQSNRFWVYWNYSMASNSLAPGYQEMYNDGDSTNFNNMDGWQIYSGSQQSKNGIYGKHSMTQSPPVPYQGKLYFLRGNSLLAFSPNGTNPKTPLSLATTVDSQGTFTPPAAQTLKQRLETEVQKMIDAGHLRPGYYPASFSDLYGHGHYSDEQEFGVIFDYFSNPADTVVALVQAYPLLSSSLQAQVVTYLQNNYGPGAKYDLTKYHHIGWGTGAPRELADIPSEVPSTYWYWQEQTEEGVVCHNTYSCPMEPQGPGCDGCNCWQGFPVYSFYAAWKYAQIVGKGDQTTAKNIFDAMNDKLEAPLSDDWLIKKPYFINWYAAGYLGFLQLKQLAGLGSDSTVQGYYDHMISLRTNHFTKDTPYTAGGMDHLSYNRVLALSRNFMFLTPEIAEPMSLNLKSQVQTAIDEYNDVGPYWFVNGFDDTVHEGTLSHLYNSPALIQAKAYILKESYNDLVKWLDVPAFALGDLFYIQNLVAILSRS